MLVCVCVCVGPSVVPLHSQISKKNIWIRRFTNPVAGPLLGPKIQKIKKLGSRLSIPKVQNFKVPTSPGCKNSKNKKFKKSRTQPSLASFKLSYVSPENHKIGKSGWWKLGRKSGVWRRKTGFENFSLDENWCFEVDLEFGKVKKMRWWRKRAENGRKDFLKKFW